MGRHEQAIAEAKRAMELDPFSRLTYGDPGWVLLMARRYDQALLESKKPSLNDSRISAMPALYLDYRTRKMAAMLRPSRKPRVQRASTIVRSCWRF